MTFLKNNSFPTGYCREEYQEASCKGQSQGQGGRTLLFPLIVQLAQHCLFCFIPWGSTGDFVRRRKIQSYNLLIYTYTTNLEDIKLGEGSVFDVDGYSPDGIAVLRTQEETDISDSAKVIDNMIPVVQHVFSKDDYSEEYIHNIVFHLLKQLRDQKCKCIGIHSSVKIAGSRENGAVATYEAIRKWATRYKKNFNQLVIVDTYGDFGKVIKRQ